MDGKRRWRGVIWFHELRHTFASVLIAQGADPVFISRQIGYNSPDITLRVYSQLFDAARHAKKLRDALDAQHGKHLGNGRWQRIGKSRRRR